MRMERLKSVFTKDSCQKYYNLTRYVARTRVDYLFKPSANTYPAQAVVDSSWPFRVLIDIHIVVGVTDGHRMKCTNMRTRYIYFW